jgi:glycosyltransferase involved in cell wall biosynthesis
MGDTTADTSNPSYRGKMGVSAVVLTKNEEQRIRRCLDSLKEWVDEIVIVDDESTDGTAKIAAQEYGAKVIIRPLNNNFDLQRNAGIDACSYGWVLQMDADEEIPRLTAQAIWDTLVREEHDAFEILRQDCVWDTPLKHVGGCYQLKLFRKAKGRYKGLIHEALQVEGNKIGRISAPIWHYAIPSIQSMIAKHNFYTDLECERFFLENPNPDIKSVKQELVLKPFKIFFKHYAKHGGYKDGIPGLIWSTIHTIHPVMFWMKVIERLAHIRGAGHARRP